MDNLVSKNLIETSKTVAFDNKFNDLTYHLEEADQKKNDVILDTSSVNKIIQDNNLSNNFFETINKRNYRAVIPYAAFSELSNNDDILQKLNYIITKQNIDLRIGEPVFIRIKREINNCIKSNSYLKKDINIFGIAKECFEPNRKHNREKKKRWVDNSKRLRKKFLKDFKHINSPEERNKEIEKKLEGKDFLINYEQNKDYWVLDFLEKFYKIKLPKENISSCKNRYKFINILQYLMFINMYRSLLSGNSEWAISRGDLFDMEIVAFSAYSFCFISEDKCLINCLKKIKSNSNELGFENKYKIYKGIETFKTK